jgi:hypothetical protein
MSIVVAALAALALLTSPSQPAQATGTTIVAPQAPVVYDAVLPIG